MAELIRTFNAETLKMKRTLALWLAFVTPAALVFLETAAAYQRKGRWIPKGDDPWLYIFEHTITIWAILVVPLFITLETALAGQNEHGNQTWKVLYTQPVPRWTILAAKQLWGLLLSGLGVVVLCGLTVAGGLILSSLRPELGFTLDIPWIEMSTQAGMVTLAAGVTLGIHSWLAIRSNSFVIASAVGIGMTIAGIILMGLDWIDYFPWSMPATALEYYYEGVSNQALVMTGVAGWVLLSVLGTLNLKEMDS